MAIDAFAHEALPSGAVHRVTNWSVADAAALAALVPTADDVGKLAYQEDTQALYYLEEESGPTWVEVGAAGATYTDEMAQDAVGGILDNGSVGDANFTYDDGTPKISAVVKNDAITYAKMQNVSATDKVLGRSSSGAGDVEEIACTAAGRAILDDADATAQKATLGLDAVRFGVTFNFGDGVNVITSSEPALAYKIPHDCTMIEWEAISVDGTSGSITVTVDRSATATPATFSEISGSSDPAISSSTSGKDTSISGDWGDVTLDADDWIRLQVTGTPSSVKRVAVALTFTRAL